MDHLNGGSDRKGFLSVLGTGYPGTHPASFGPLERLASDWHPQLPGARVSCVEGETASVGFGKTLNPRRVLTQTIHLGRKDVNMRDQLSALHQGPLSLTRAVGRTPKTGPRPERDGLGHFHGTQGQS